ncbi:MAG: restriction endonuclease subunit S [Candidatus Saccharibacteria bacterium]|nr:restriction endonuclease subunit S [Rhodoferax sp.]
MELRAGYKQTEVGVIPIDWSVREFYDITEVITCGVAATPTYVSESIGFPFLSAQNVRNGRVVWDKHKYIGRDLFQQITRHNKPLQGDILYTRVGAGIGEAGIVESEVPFGIYVSLTLIKIDKKQVVNGFILNLLNSPKYRLIAKGGQFAGGGVQNLNVDVVRKFLIPVPPISEQHAIATALSDVDALLAKIDQLIAKKRDLKQAAMQQFLTGQSRLPGFSGKWEVRRLGDVATANKGSQLPNSESAASGNYEHLNGGVEPSSYTAKANAPGESIAISEGGNSCGFVQYMKDPYWCGGHCYSVIPRGVGNAYLYHALKGRQSEIMGLRVGSGLPNIQKSALLNFVVSFPTDKFEQTAIAIVLTDMDAELAALEARRDKTRALKQGMMQALLTGRIRLVRAD